MNSLKAMYGCGLNFFIKLAYNSLFLYKFAATNSTTPLNDAYHGGTSLFI